MIRWSLGITLGLPILASLIFHANTMMWQHIMLLVAGLWLGVCGFFTVTAPFSIARYFGRPGTYDLLIRRPSAVATWYLRAAGLMMFLLGLGIAFAAALLILGW